METPPPFAPPPSAPVRKSRTGLIIVIILGAFSVCCALPLGLVAFFGMRFAGKMGPSVACMVGFAEVQLAVRDYTEAHDGRFPDAKSWQDDVRKYYAKRQGKNEDMPKMFKSLTGFPASGEWSCTDDRGHKTGIAFNVDLSGKKVSDIQNPYGTPMIFEVESIGTNQAMKYVLLDRKDGPVMMGKRRGYLVFNVLGKDKNDVNFTFDGSDSSGNGSKGSSDGN